MDGDNGIYPLAFGVGDSKNDKSWGWFFTKLKVAIGELDDLVIVSDRHPSILNCVNNIFPNAHHGACVHHLAMNIRSKFKSTEVIPLYYVAAKAYTIHDFNRIFSKLNAQDERVGSYLRGVGFECWARSHFSGRHYSLMTSNIAESLNNVLKDARELPIMGLMEHLTSVMQRWFNDRRILAASWNVNGMAKEVEKQLGRKNSISLHYQVSFIDMHTIYVRDGDRNSEVNLNMKTCTCRMFDVDKLPCGHAIAAARYRGVDYRQNCDPKYLSTSIVVAYAESIYPIGHCDYWNMPVDVAAQIILPPLTKRKKGKPTKKRKPNIGEIKRFTKCSKCGKPDHNKATYKSDLQMVVEDAPVIDID